MSAKRERKRNQGEQARRRGGASAPNWERIGRYIVGVSMGAALVGALGMAGSWALEPENLPVRTLRVKGELQHVTEAQLRELIPPHVANGLLRVDIAAIRAAVEGLPWVARASVRRAWPDTVELSVREQEPVARWGDDGLVSARGEVFRPEDLRGVPALPALSGPDDTAPMVVKHFRQLRALMLEAGLEVHAASMDERRAWSVTLGNGVGLMLGRDAHERRLRRFLRVYGPSLSQWAGQIKQVDLRYTNGFAVRWRSQEAPV